MDNDVEDVEMVLEEFITEAKESPIEEGNTSTDIHGQNSLSIKYGGDIRMLLMANRAFVMQLAHPAVGAGVVQHSVFQENPWRRLHEIHQSGVNMMFKGRQGALDEGNRLRELHRNIKGVDNQGNRYHALNPETYGWVHFIFLESTITAHRLFGNPIPAQDQERMFREWRQSGFYFGLRSNDMPGTLQEYWDYLDFMIESKLEYNQAIDYILSIGRIAPIKPKQLSNMPDSVWRLLFKPIGASAINITIGSFPAAFRKKVLPHIAWNNKQELAFNTQRHVIGAIVNHLPDKWKYPEEAYRILHGQQ